MNMALISTRILRARPDGRAKIKIKSSFGSVNLAHTWSSENDKSEGRGKDKDKSKHKHKDKDDDDDDNDSTI